MKTSKKTTVLQNRADGTGLADSAIAKFLGIRQDTYIGQKERLVKLATLMHAIIENLFINFHQAFECDA